jgi:N-methylhydantoinase B
MSTIKKKPTVKKKGARLNLSRTSKTKPTRAAAKKIEPGPFSGKKPDPITLEIIKSRVREIVATMSHLLYHSGYSTILRESRDGSACICDREGHGVDTEGAPLQVYSYYLTVKSIIDNYPIETMREGDCYISSDPYAGGTLHVPDIVIVTPIFVDGVVIGFCASIAHKPDVGGMVPGSSGAGAREIFHEGLILPGVLYWNKDGVNREVESIIKRNCRIPEIIAGDLRAQVGCTLIGVKHVKELCKEYGAATIVAAFEELLAISERRVRAKLLEWPDGEAEAETLVDDDGVDIGKPVHVKVKVIKKGDSITFDYSQLHPQVKGPTNLRPQSSQVAALLALMVILDPTIPTNDGARRPITFISPEGTIANPKWPAPVNSYYGLTNVLFSTLGKALAQFDSSRAVASNGLGVGAIAVGYDSNRLGRKAVQYELFVTAQGGTSDHDGSSGTSGFLNVSPSTPLEVLETEFPARVTCFEWIVDSAGPGKYRGGVGNRKEYEMLGEATLTLRLGHQFHFSGWGVYGGKAPRPMQVWLNYGTDRQEAMKPLHTIQLKPGDRFMIEMAGGGGYGPPFERDPESVLRDVRRGYVSREAAEREYGVAIDAAKKSVDMDRTRFLRSVRTTLAA